MLCFLYGLFFGYRFPSTPPINLEIFPDELLLEIFSYASISDLFYGWLNLNSRFNNILHSMPMKIFDTKQQGSSSKDSNDSEAFRYFALQLVSLQLRKSYSESIMINIDLLSYPNLRILALDEVTSTQLDIIREHNFPHLKHLSLGKTSDFNFETLCEFKLLRSCEVFSLKINADCSCSSLSIRLLSINNCNFSDIAHLLRCLPQLKTFNVYIFYTRDSYNFDPTAVFIHPTLKSLDITILNFVRIIDATDYDLCSIITSLLNYISPDRGGRCSFALCGTAYFDFEQLQRTLIKLNFCRFSCYLFHFLRYNPAPNFERIRQLPLFNRHKPISTDSDMLIIYHSTWTNTNHASTK